MTGTKLAKNRAKTKKREKVVFLQNGDTFKLVDNDGLLWDWQIVRMYYNPLGWFVIARNDFGNIKLFTTAYLARLGYSFKVATRNRIHWTETRLKMARAWSRKGVHHG